MTMILNKPFRDLFFSAFVMFFVLFSPKMFAEEVDVLFLYDDYSKERFNGSPNTAVINWVDQVNGYYEASNVDITLRVVGVLNYTVAGDSMDVVLNNARLDTWISQQRNDVGADFVSVIHKTGECGIGYMAVDANWAYSVVGADCGNGDVLAHELGHNMGLNHSRAQGDTEGARYKYAMGHGVNNSFGTLMTYYWVYNGKSASVFSNPNIDCFGSPCGVEEGESAQADAAKALNNVKSQLAGFRQTVSSSSSSTTSSSSSGSNSSTTSSSSSGSSSSTTSSSTSGSTSSSTTSSSSSSSSNSSSSGGQLVNLALGATASTSYVSPWETLDAVNDGYTPMNSNDKTNGAYGNWYNPNSIQWVQYDFTSSVVVEGSDVYWFDDDGGVLVPTTAYIEYWNGAGWVKLGDVPLVENAFNVLSHAAVETTRLRISMLNTRQSTGILEWRVNGYATSE